MARMKGAQIVIEVLKEMGVDTVFGYPGGAIINIYDELYKHSNEVRHFRTAHEQAAVHAADGYSRATGKVGVCMATSGPGACNMVTGIATAYMDSVPLVAITCNVSLSLLGKDSFQEVDIAGITSPITKHNYIVKDVRDLANTLREAFAIARSDRPGPVLVDMTKDVTSNEWDYEPLPADKAVKSPKVIRLFTPEDIKELARIISESKKPFIFAGGGVIASGASQELLWLAELINAPTACSLMGLGAISTRHGLFTGMIGMHGTKASNMAANRADLILAIGVRFSDRVISDPKRFAMNAKVVHIDIDQAEINKTVQVAKHVTGDAKAILSALLPLLKPRQRDEWNQEVDGWKKTVPEYHTKKKALHPRFMLETVNKLAGDSAIISTEVGQHQMWTAQFYPFSRPRSFLTSGGLGTMGYGTGAAIGAQIAQPEARVIHVAGDGSFRMNYTELATIQHYGIPLIMLIMNNGTLGMVRQWQKLFYQERYSQTTLDHGPDFVKLAEVYGIKAFRATDEASFTKALESALCERKPALIDCMIDMDDGVFPMVPSGKPIDEQILD